MKECAFCEHQGKLSAEHIVSDWMESLFPGELGIRRTSRLGIKTEQKASKIDWKAKVYARRAITLG